MKNLSTSEADDCWIIIYLSRTSYLRLSSWWSSDETHVLRTNFISRLLLLSFTSAWGAPLARGEEHCMLILREKGKWWLSWNGDWVWYNIFPPIITVFTHFPRMIVVWSNKMRTDCSENTWQYLSWLSDMHDYIVQHMNGQNTIKLNTQTGK